MGMENIPKRVYLVIYFLKKKKKNTFWDYYSILVTWEILLWNKKKKPRYLTLIEKEGKETTGIKKNSPALLTYN